jgi:hypothetical protein
MPAEVDADAEADFAFILGALAGAAAAASRPTPGTRPHSKICVCTGCVLRAPLERYWTWVSRHERYYPNGPAIGR